MAPLIALALKLAPFIAPHVLDKLSSGHTRTPKAAADTVLHLAQTITGVVDPAAAAEAVLADKTFQLEMRKQSAAVLIAEIQETQATARVEAISTDEYVRRTRPMLARRSFGAGVAYSALTAVVFPVCNALYGTQLPGPSEWLLGAILSPLLTYIGARTADKFAQRGQ